jgi:hypothetical protein
MVHVFFLSFDLLLLFILLGFVSEVKSTIAEGIPAFPYYRPLMRETTCHQAFGPRFNRKSPPLSK